MNLRKYSNNLPPQHLYGPRNQLGRKSINESQLYIQQSRYDMQFRCRAMVSAGNHKQDRLAIEVATSNSMSRSGSEQENRQCDINCSNTYQLYTGEKQFTDNGREHITTITFNYQASAWGGALNGPLRLHPHSTEYKAKRAHISSSQINFIAFTDIFIIPNYRLIYPAWADHKITSLPATLLITFKNSIGSLIMTALIQKALNNDPFTRLSERKLVKLDFLLKANNLL